MSEGSERQVNNKGFSLVELVVVIAIMGVMVGVLSFGISMMFSRDAETVARQIDEGLTETRMLSMSKAGVYVMQITKDGDKADKIVILSKNGVSSEEYKSIDIKKEAEVTCTGAYSATNTDGIEVQFDKSNGALFHVGDFDTALTSADAAGVYTIEVNAKNKNAKVKLVTTTGRHFLEK